VLVVQQIQAEYLKPGRGGEEARRRASLPLGALLPDWDGEPGFVSHTLRGWGPDYMLKDAKLEIATAPRREEPFLCFEDGIRVLTSQAGAPYRRSVPLRLEGRRWVRVRLNGRKSWECTWYVDVTINIGRFESPPPANLFTSTGPDHVIDLRASLW